MAQRTGPIVPDYQHEVLSDEEGFWESEHSEYPPPTHPDEAPPEPSAAGAPRDMLHPMEAPPPSLYIKDKVQVIEEFAARIASIDEGDYGDWMRRANMYLWQLQEALWNESSAVQRGLREMQMIIQFRPDFRIRETARRVVVLATWIRDLLGGKGYQGAHDYHVSTTVRTKEEPVPSYSQMLENPTPPDIESVVGPGNDLSINSSAQGKLLPSEVRPGPPI